MRVVLLISCLSFFILGCSSRRMWPVNQHQNGGVIAYQNYDGVSNEQWLIDVKSQVQCPNSFRMGAWERKSQTGQSVMYLPKTETLTSRTNSNYEVNNSYGSNLLNIEGNQTQTATYNTTEAIPYTYENVWIEHSYICDREKVARQKTQSLTPDQKKAKHLEKCSEGNTFECLMLGTFYIKDEPEKFTLLMENVCGMTGDKQDISTGCLYAGTNALKQNKKIAALKYFEKGCNNYSQLELSKNAEAAEACGYVGAYKKDKKLLEIGVQKQMLKCIEEKKCYNIACFYSIYGDKDSSLKYLKIALEGGFNDWSHIEKDKDLDNIKNTADFKNLIKNYKERSPASDLNK